MLFDPKYEPLDALEEQLRRAHALTPDLISQHAPSGRTAGVIGLFGTSAASAAGSSSIVPRRSSRCGGRGPAAHRVSEARMSGQSQRMSVIEAVANTFGGFVVALWAQVTIFPWFGIHISMYDSVGIAIIMMVISLVRQYAFRRFFNWIDGRPKHTSPTPDQLLDMIMNSPRAAKPLRQPVDVRRKRLRHALPH
jgi:hypothetical protein